LKNWFEEKTPDDALLKLYHTEKLSELCIKISKESSTSLESSKTVFRTNLLKLVPESSTLNKVEIESVVDFAYNRLRNIGVGLSI
jgi:hypothetical protein